MWQAAPARHVLWAVLLLLAFGCSSGRAGFSTRIWTVPSLELLAPLAGKQVTTGNAQAIPWFGFDLSTAHNNWTDLVSWRLQHHRQRHADRGFSICLVMSDSRAVSPPSLLTPDSPPLSYWESSVYINLLYADRHGYDFLRFQLSDEGLTRAPAWYKLACVAAVLDQYDYVMYVDSDVYIRMQEVKLEHIISDYGLDRDKTLLLPVNGFREGDTSLNTGVMIFRQHPATHDLLEEWWRRPITDPSLADSLHQHIRRRVLWEQAVMNAGIAQQFEGAIAQGNTSWFCTPAALFTRHVWTVVGMEGRNAQLSAALVYTFIQDVFAASFAHMGSVS